jgi:hypothetical protein
LSSRLALATEPNSVSKNKQRQEENHKTKAAVMNQREKLRGPWGGDGGWRRGHLCPPPCYSWGDGRETLVTSFQKVPVHSAENRKQDPQVADLNENGLRVVLIYIYICKFFFLGGTGV